MTKRKKVNPDVREITSKPQPTIESNVITRLIPRKVELKRALDKMEAYRSNLGNLFTPDDPTLTDEGWVRLFTDTGYYGDVQKALTIYQQDDLIGGLVDSLVNVANTDVNFDLPSNNQNEAAAWKQWSRMVNSDTRNVLPGLKSLDSQLMRSMVLTGMAVPDFEWGTITVGRKIYEFPMKISLYPVLGIKLEASTSDFGDEGVLLGVSDKFYKDTLSDATDDIAIRTLFTEWDDKGKKAMRRLNAYAIKFRYTPNNQTLYPSPMLRRSFESIALRHKLIDADISTLELIINKIIQIKVGDKDNPPRPTQYDENGAVIKNGDIDEAQELFEDMRDVFEVIATPYFYDISMVMPETDVLLDQAKYVQSTFNIYSNFGILLDPSSSANSTSFEKMNLKNYEKNAIDLQQHASGWYMWLAMQIIKRNKGRLKALPSVSFDKPDVYDEKYLEQLTNLYTLGGPDIYTILEKYGLDPDKIAERKDLQDKEEDKWEARATFKQEVVEGGNTKSVSTSDGGGSNKKPAKSKEDD